MPLKDKEAHRAYCRAYYYSHAGKDRQRRPRRTREQVLERKRKYSVEYRRANADKIRAYKSRPEVRAKHNAYNRMWRQNNYEKHREYMREYMRVYMQGKRRLRVPLTEAEIRRRHERMKEWKRAYYHANIAYFQISSFMYRKRIIERMKVDPDFYARERKKQRLRHKRARERLGLPYTPRPSMRIPDWCVRGGVLDTRSAWMWENVSREQRAFAREMFIERKERRAR